MEIKDKEPLILTNQVHGLTYVAPTSLFIFILPGGLLNKPIKEDKICNQLKNSALVVLYCRIK